MAGPSFRVYVSRGLVNDVRRSVEAGCIDVDDTATLLAAFFKHLRNHNGRMMKRKWCELAQDSLFALLVKYNEVVRKHNEILAAYRDLKADMAVLKAREEK